MLHVNLTVAQNISDDKARHTIDQLVTSLSGHAGADGAMAAGFAAAGERQVQGYFYSADQAVGFILSAARSAVWGIQLTLVPQYEVDKYQLSTVDAASHLQSEVEADGVAAVRAPGGVVVRLLQNLKIVDYKKAPELGLIESSLQLLSAIERRRSGEGQEAGFMINAGTSQTLTAQKLGVSQQAVSARLQAGYWYESRRVAYWLAVQIHELLEG